jgi:hypothetical protein
MGAVQTPQDPRWHGERTIVELWPTLETSRRLNAFADERRNPFIGGALYLLGDLLRVLVYCLDVSKYLAVAGLNVLRRLFGAEPIQSRVRSIVRYTLTNRRLRVDEGPAKRTAQFVPLEDIDEIRLVQTRVRSRTADLEILKGGTTILTLHGIHDPVSARQTILDAVRARIEVAKVLEQQKQTASTEA